MQGKEKLFSVLFTLPQHRDTRDSSYLMKSTLMTDIRPVMPDSNQLPEFDAGMNPSLLLRLNDTYYTRYLFI